MWKIYFFLILFFGLTGMGLKLTGPMIVEKWINKHGAGNSGYAFSVRDVEFSLAKGQVFLKDIKIFNPKTQTELIEAPNLTVQFNWPNFFLSDSKNVSVTADNVDLILSSDFSSEIARIKDAGNKLEEDVYLSNLEGKIARLNIIERKEDQSRTVLELNELNLKLKEASLHSINKKTEFNVSSKLADGGKLNLTGKTRVEGERTPWTIQGSLKKVPSDIFNKIAGDKLPFSFNESHLNAEISAHSDRGEVSGEIAPDIKRLNLLQERPGVPTRSIARALTDELTFSLPFTLKEELSFNYADTYHRLKTYRKYPAATESSDSAKTQVSQTKKTDSFWPF